MTTRESVQEDRADAAKSRASRSGESTGQPPLLALKDLSKSYREGSRLRRVLQHVNAEFAPGESVAILGKSGSGKSTLLNLISGIDRPDRGAVWFGERSLTSMTERDRTLLRRRRIGFIFQFFNLIPMLTVWENVTLPLELNGEVSERAFARACALLDGVGLADRATAYPDRLSGGEQQRVALARALVHSPDLILADEPTGNLDEATGKQVMTLLDRLTRQEGKTLLVATHNAEAIPFTDRVMSLRAGRLLEGADADPGRLEEEEDE